jgi:hypothetical protein
MASLVTPEELIIYLDLPAGTQPTDRAQMVVDQASAIVRSACRWQISQVLDDIFVVPVFSDTIALPTLRLTTVTSVTINGVTVNSSVYRFTSSGLIIATSAQRFWGTPATVVATHGYATGTMPTDVKAATLQLAARLYSNPLSVKAEAIDDASRDYGTSTSTGLLDAMIAPYVLPSVAA